MVRSTFTIKYSTVLYVGWYRIFALLYQSARHPSDSRKMDFQATSTFQAAGAGPFHPQTSQQANQILAQQDHYIREQDRALGTISDQLGVLRTMGRRIGGELGDQARHYHFVSLTMCRSGESSHEL